MIKKRKMTTLVLVLTLCISALYRAPISYAAESQNVDVHFQQAQALVENSEGSYALAVVTNDGLVVVDEEIARVTLHKGYVTGDGVRLRKAPKSTAAVLELMSKNEVVVIDYTASGNGCSSGKWFYVQRVKTGTWGWMSVKYLGL